MFRLDNSYYDAEYLIKDGYGQTADILNGSNSGRLQGTGSMYIEYLGTFFNSAIKLRRGINCTDEQWNSFYLALCNPINKHNIDIPFGSGFLTLDIYISQVKRNQIKTYFNENKNIPIWDKTIEFTATAVNSNWRAGGQLTGYSG